VDAAQILSFFAEYLFHNRSLFVFKNLIQKRSYLPSPSFSRGLMLPENLLQP
jgi:hypothetical protein